MSGAGEGGPPPLPDDNRRRITSGSTFEAIAGYSRAVVWPDPAGDWVFVSGTTGYDYTRMRIEPTVASQTHQAFKNIGAALTEAGASLDDVVRVNYYLASRHDFRAVAPIFGEYLSHAKPAATAVICDFIEPEILIEIEVTARRPPAGEGRS